MSSSNGSAPDIVIDLDKLSEPSGVVRISEDETYPLRQFDGFSYFEQRALAKQWNRVVEIELAADVSDAEATEYEKIARVLFVRICDMPKKKAGALTIPQVMDVVGRFFGVQLRRGRVRTPNLTQILASLATSEPSPSASTPAGRDQEAPTNG